MMRAGWLLSGILARTTKNDIRCCLWPELKPVWTLDIDHPSSRATLTRSAEGSVVTWSVARNRDCEKRQDPTLVYCEASYVQCPPGETCGGFFRSPTPASFCRTAPPRSGVAFIASGQRIVRQGWISIGKERNEGGQRRTVLYCA